MKILCISDTHGHHELLKIPEGIDMIIHAGDGSNSKAPYLNESEMISFLYWFANLSVKYKVFVAGNHDTSIEKKLVNPRDWKDIIYLEHGGTEIQGIKIFGSPYTPEFHDWAFNVARHKIDKYWQQINNAPDILITHGPPKGFLDIARKYEGTDSEIEYCGCKSLLNKVLEIKPKYHIFGHIHDNGENLNKGIRVYDGITFINASCVTDRKFSEGLTSQGVVIDF